MANQKKFIVDGGLHVVHDSTILANIEMGGHIIPNIDSDGFSGYDLGSPTMKWRDLYLSQGSLYIDGQKVLESNAGTIVVQADVDQSMTIKTAGVGVLTLDSDTAINVSANINMLNGTKFLANGGNVVFGDKLDMDNNQIINVSNPTTAQGVATKDYVDGLVSGLSQDAIREGDSEIEIADLGTGTVGITVDGVQRMTVSGAEANFAVTPKFNGDDLATANSVSSSLQTAKDYTDAREATIVSGYQSAVQTETDARVIADQALQDSIDSILANTDPAALDSLAEIVTAYQTADANLNGAISSAATTAASDATAKADQALVDAKAYVDAEVTALSGTLSSTISSVSTSVDDLTTDDVAEGDNLYFTDARAQAAVAQDIADASNGSEATAAADATAKANAAQAAAEATASADATAKADAAEANANTYTDTKVAELVDAAPGALDTLNELAAAMGDDENFATTVTNNIATAKAQAYGYTDTKVGDEASARSTAIASLSNTVTNNFTTLTNDIATAKSQAISSAEGYTDSAVASEAGLRSSADSTLQSNIDSEETARVNADAALQAQINTEKGRIDAINVGNGAVTVSGGTGLSGSGTFSMNQSNNETVTLAIDTAWLDARDDYITALSFNTTNGVLTADMRLSDDLTVDLDGRYQLAGSYAASVHGHVIADVTGLQAALDAKATPADVTAAINNLVDGAPAALNTLNELAAAIGDNANYAASITTALAGKVDDSQVLTNVPAGAVFTDTNTWRPVVDNVTSTSTSSSLSANQGRVLKNLIDGKLGSGSTAVNADKVDGLHASSFIRSDANDTATGVITFSNTTEASGANTGAVQVRGGMSISKKLFVGGDVTAYSDERLKDNVEVIENAGEKVAALRGVTFTHKSDGTESTGVIAQDVQKVLPEAVSEDDAGMLAVKYGNMVGLLIEAVKELQAEVAELKKK